MVRINKIYTRTGDDGKTALVDGSRVEKNSVRVEAYGEVDELNSAIGLACSNAKVHGYDLLVEQLCLIQNELFDIGSSLATPESFDKYPLFEVQQKHIDRLESWIDDITGDLEPLKSFVIPGGNETNALLHMARAICRRVERKVISLSQSEKVDRNVIVYLNRLSDLLFAYARWSSKQAGDEECLWVPWKDRGD